VPRLAASVTMMFHEVGLLERFARAAEAGFRGVEIQSPYGETQEDIAERLRRHDLSAVLMNIQPGVAAIPGREAEFPLGALAGARLRMEGFLAETVKANIDIIGHFQVGGVPGRHEPDETQEVNYTYLFDLIDGLGYGGWVGCEYRPRAGTIEGLGWGRPYGIRGGR